MQAFSAPAGGRPTADDLLQALGRELWVVGDELLTISARMKVQAGALGTGAISLRNAADMMIEGEWEEVMGELETAAISCEEFLPYDRWEGLVNLFSYYEPMPEYEWMAARGTLLGLEDGLIQRFNDILRGMEGSYRAESEESLVFVMERLNKASKLFEAGGFYMPDDPRDKVAREGKGAPREPQQRPFSWAKPPPDEEAVRRKWRWDAARAEADRAVEAVGGRSPAFMAEVDGALEAAAASSSPDDARRKTLRKLVRKLHPDVNQGYQDEVRPVFEYVQRLREEEMQN